MSDVVISCLHINNPLPAGSVLVNLEDNVLNGFHGFRVSQILADHMQRRVGDEEISPYQYDFNLIIWDNIFNYLTVKEIFRFVIAMPRWCRSCHLNELRNKYVFFAAGSYLGRSAFVGNFMGILQSLPANARLKLVAVESNEFHSSPRVTSYESLNLNEFILLRGKAVNVTHYGKIHTSSTIFRPALAERKDWLTSLQRLEISSTNFKMTDVINILNLCGQLLDLKIGFEEVAYHASYGDLTLNDDLKLERLDLSDSHLVVRDLQFLLNKTVNLKILILKKFMMTCYFADLELVPDSLRQLQKMILQGANFTGKNIHALLMAAPHVNEVDLSCQTILDGGRGLGYAFGPGLQRAPHTRLHNSFSVLPEKSLESLEMVHVSPTFFLSDRLPVPREMIMTVNSPILNPSMCEQLLSLCSFTLRDLQQFLKAAPNLHPDVRMQFEGQIAIQQKFVDIIIADRSSSRDSILSNSHQIHSSSAVSQMLSYYREVAEKMKADTQRLKEDNERALAKMKKAVKKSKKW